jgi:hypothetical protein
METKPGLLLEPRTWCRRRPCRDDAAAEHWPGDGCTCDPHGRTDGVEEAPRLTVLRARATRLPAFACRACGASARRMIEYPTLYFRCEPCAQADRWPDFHRGAGR